MSRVSPTIAFARSSRLLAAGALFLFAYGTVWPITGMARATQSVLSKVCSPKDHPRRSQRARP
jgi:hypothetical protein